MYYFMISAAALLFSLQFVFQNGFRQIEGGGWQNSLKFSLYSAIASVIALMVINGCHLEFSWFSMAVAVAYSLMGVVLSYCSIKALEYANLSVYSVFSMIGGMTLPFGYGVLCGESVGIAQWICFVLIAVSVTLSIQKGEQSRKAIKYYIAVFILNGSSGVISKFHQSYTEICVDSASFLMLSRIFSAVLCTVLLLFTGKKAFAVTKKSMALCAGYSVFNSVGNLLLLIALLYLPASVQYPIVTGGVIVFSTAIELLRHNAVSKRDLVAAAVAFAATVFMAF